MTRPHVSPAFAVAVLALVVALTGVSYAAVQLSKNSVGAKHLKKNAVTSKKIKAGAVNGAKVRDNSLTGTDIDESTLVLPAKTRTISIPATAFRTPDAATTTGLSGGGVTRVSGTSPLFAPLNLPQGAEVTGIAVYVVDDATPQGISALTNRVNLTTGVISAGTPSSSTGDAPEIQKLQPAVAALGLIDNTTFTYSLVVNYGASPSDLELWGASITYKEPA